MKEMLICTSSNYPDVCLKVTTTASSLTDTMKLQIGDCGYVANNLGNMSYEAAYCVKEFCVGVGGVGNYLLTEAAAQLRNCGLRIVTAAVEKSSFYRGAGIASGIYVGTAVLAAVTFFGVRAWRRRNAEQKPLVSNDTSNDLELTAQTAGGFQANGG